MPQKLAWTDSTDTQLKRLRQGGARWDDVAACLGVNRTTAIARAQRLGIRVLPPPRPPAHEDDSLADPNREPLQAGHAISWGAITAGTLLDGTLFTDAGDAA